MGAGNNVVDQLAGQISKLDRLPETTLNSPYLTKALFVEKSVTFCTSFSLH
jgi:hypothetical protein